MGKNAKPFINFEIRTNPSLHLAPAKNYFKQFYFVKAKFVRQL